MNIIVSHILHYSRLFAYYSFLDLYLCFFKKGCIICTFTLYFKVNCYIRPMHFAIDLCNMYVHT